jgi:hypothetical protein
VVNSETVVKSEQYVELRKRLTKDGVDSRSTPKTGFDSENGVNPEKRATILSEMPDGSDFLVQIIQRIANLNDREAAMLGGEARGLDISQCWTPNLQAQWMDANSLSPLCRL